MKILMPTVYQYIHLIYTYNIQEVLCWCRFNCYMLILKFCKYAKRMTILLYLLDAYFL